MFETFVRLQESGVEPVFPVPTDPKIGDATERSRISHPTSKLWAELSDLRYQILVGELWLATLLTPSGAPEDLRKELFQKRIIREMRISIGRISAKLASLPRIAAPSPFPSGIPPTASTAGAPFQLPDPASLPVDIAGWKQFLKHRFAATAALCARLDSAENTVGLTLQDKTLLSNLQTGDQQLAALLGS